MLDESSASSGIKALDDALGGIYWGDNVVWEPEERDGAEPFYRAIAALAADHDLAAFVTVGRTPEELRRTFPGFQVVDARAGTELAQPRALMNAVRQLCRSDEEDLLLFDSLESMAELWGTDTARAFFVQCCPMLLELGAIAYWSVTPSAHPQGVRREIEEVTQCVIAVSEGRVRITKAEGRPPRVEGAVFRYRSDDGAPELEAAPAAARLGAALRAVRVQRGLSQSQLARLAGVSASAVSQAERGQRGLSLETLLQLTDQLQITLDALLRGESSPGYRLARRRDPPAPPDGRLLRLLDDPNAGLRTYLIRLPPGASSSPPFAHKGIELVAVARGLVQCLLPGGRPVLREGESLLAEQSAISGWRNLGDAEAMLFWILRDA
ncbi:MAG TPA: XRE family transcriptional regulator [Gaiellaceae bacterium]|nr:XRE family transcriptional regulator [Gaiellaceae bacterium]